MEEVTASVRLLSTNGLVPEADEANNVGDVEIWSDFGHSSIQS